MKIKTLRTSWISNNTFTQNIQWQGPK